MCSLCEELQVLSLPHTHPQEALTQDSVIVLDWHIPGAWVGTCGQGVAPAVTLQEGHIRGRVGVDVSKNVCMCVYPCECE